MTEAEQSTLSATILRLVFLEREAAAKAKNALALSRFRNEVSPPASVATWQGEASAYKLAVATISANFQVDSRQIYGRVRAFGALNELDIKNEEINWFLQYYRDSLYKLVDMTDQQILDEFVGAQYDQY